MTDRELFQEHYAEIYGVQPKSYAYTFEVRDGEYVLLSVRKSFKLWSLNQAIETARVDADEDFDLFLNYLSNILKGNQDKLL